MSITITRTAWVDDDGTGTYGTIINNAAKTSLYDQIDAALAALLPLAGGTLTGHLLFTDNTYDIGASGATRPRHVYIAGEVKQGVWNAGAITTSGGVTVNGGTIAVNGSSNPGLSLLVSGTQKWSLYSDASDVLTIREYGVANRLTIASGGAVVVGGTFTVSGHGTTASAANAFLDSGTGLLSRSTSSRRFKTDIAPLDLASASRVVMGLCPITYRSTDNPTDGARRWAGFIAEDVAALEKLLATYDPDGTPNYVTYDRIPAYLVPVVQSHEQRLAALEAHQRLAA